MTIDGNKKQTNLVAMGFQKRCKNLPESPEALKKLHKKSRSLFKFFLLVKFQSKKSFIASR